MQNLLQGILRLLYGAETESILTLAMENKINHIGACSSREILKNLKLRTDKIIKLGQWL